MADCARWYLESLCPRSDSYRHLELTPLESGCVYVAPAAHTSLSHAAERVYAVALESASPLDLDAIPAPPVERRRDAALYRGPRCARSA